MALHLSYIIQNMKILLGSLISPIVASVTINVYHIPAHRRVNVSETTKCSHKRFPIPSLYSAIPSSSRAVSQLLRHHGYTLTVQSVYC
jgi:hypothetical protein